MASSASTIYPPPPLPNKSTQGPIGADLTITYHSDLAQCEILPAGSRYTTAGNLKAGTFLAFNQPAFIHDLYPHLLSTEDGEGPGLPLLLSMFNTEATTANLQEDWEGKWCTITARVCPNKLKFDGVRLDGWEPDQGQCVQVALALPRDGGLTPIIPRLLGGSEEGAPWPSSSAYVSFAGPVDLDTYHINEDAWPEHRVKTSVFVKLGSYLAPEDNRPPHKGIHTCHVLVLFPLDQQPWTSLLGWMRKARNPFSKRSWVACSGRVLGILNRDLIHRHRLDPTVRILVVLPDNWEFIRQSTLSTVSTSSDTSADLLLTPPRPSGPGGVASRNPFSSPSHRGQFSSPSHCDQFSSPQEKATSTTLPPKNPDHRGNEPRHGHREQGRSSAGTIEVAPMHTIASLGTYVADSSSDIAQSVDHQLASTDITPTRKRKELSTPEPVSDKRTTAWKKKARIHD